MRQLTTKLVLVVIGVLSAASFAIACDFCGPAQSPLGEKLAKSDVVVLAKWVSAIPAKGASQGSTKFVLVEQLGGKKKELKFAAGYEIKFPRESRANPNERCVLFGFDRDEELTWETPQPVTDAAIAYLREAPPFDQPIRERLVYFLKHLESPDPLISMDVFAEFGCAPSKDVIAIAPHFDRTRLREIVASDKTSSARLGLYGMMLGLCGDKSAARLLRERLDRPQKDQYLLGLDGMTFGYLLLAGSAGLDELDKIKLNGDEKNFNHCNATMSALRVMWTDGQDRIPRERLKQSMRRLLDHPQLADLAIADLARWHDWTVMDRLMEMHASVGKTDKHIRVAIVHYMFTAAGGESKRTGVGKSQKKVEQIKAEKPAAVTAQAKAHLATLRKRDPTIVQNAERFFRLD